MNQKKVWDAISSEWNKFRTRTVREVVEFLNNKNGRVLDLGCGSGRNFIDDKKLQIYGVDFSKKLLSIAKSKNYVELKNGVADNIPYDDEFFNYIVFVRVLHCIKGEEKRKKTLDEIYRVLKHGGEAVIGVIGQENQRVKNKPKECILPWTIEGVKYKRYNYTYDKDELVGQLKDAGFNIVFSEGGNNTVVVVRK